MAIEKRDDESPYGRPLRGVVSEVPAVRADLTSPIGAGDPGADNATLCHWHLIGGCWRPLHEQLNALSDAATWVRAWAPESSSAPGIAEPVELADKLSVASVQCGHEFAAVIVSGALDGIATRQLRACLRGLIAGGVHSLLIDLSQASGPMGGWGSCSIALKWRCGYDRGGSSCSTSHPAFGRLSTSVAFPNRSQSAGVAWTGPPFRMHIHPLRVDEVRTRAGLREKKGQP